jgi:hypothetical protein
MQTHVNILMSNALSALLLHQCMSCSTRPQFANAGLDAMMRQMFQELETMLAQPAEDINLMSPYFHYIHEACCSLCARAAQIW